MAMNREPGALINARNEGHFELQLSQALPVGIRFVTNGSWLPHTCETSQMIKLISLLVRPSEMTKADFLHAWRVEHAEMALAVPGLRRFVLNVIRNEPSRPDVPDYPFTCDGIAELWFDDETQMKQVLATDALKQWRAHGATFIGSIKAFLVEEQIVIAGDERLILLPPV